MFLLLLVASFALILLPQLILAGLLGFVEEEVALFEYFLSVSRKLAVCGRRGRAAAAGRVTTSAATALPRTDAPRGATAAATLRELLEFLAAAASHSSPVPVEFLGLGAPLLHPDLLGRRRGKTPGAVRAAAIRGARRRGRLAVRAFCGGQRRSESGREPSGAQRGSHLEASPSIYSLSPTAASAAFFTRRAGAGERAVRGAGLGDLIDTRGKDGVGGIKAR